MPPCTALASFSACSHRCCQCAPPLCGVFSACSHCWLFLNVQVNASEAAGKPMILINPNLGDIPSSGGVMGIMGRHVQSAQLGLVYVDTLLTPLWSFWHF